MRRVAVLAAFRNVLAAPCGVAFLAVAVPLDAPAFTVALGHPLAVIHDTDVASQIDAESGLPLFQFLLFPDCEDRQDLLELGNDAHES